MLSPADVPPGSPTKQKVSTMKVIYWPSSTARHIPICDVCAESAHEWAGVEQNAPSAALADPEDALIGEFSDEDDRAFPPGTPCERCGGDDAAAGAPALEAAHA